MLSISDDIDLTNVEIAKALSAAAAIRSGESDATAAAWVQSEPTTISEALAESINLGATILGRSRHNPFQPEATPSGNGPGALLELARFSAAILIVADFICEEHPVSSAAIAMRVKVKTLDVVESFVGVERSVMLLAGMIPVASAIESGEATAGERTNSHTVALTALSWAITEYCVTAQRSDVDELAAAA